jgi:signal transduction histidine kinase/HAMP domain-containing protein
MRTPFSLSEPVAKPGFFSSLGMKMLMVSSLLLILSFMLCSGALLFLTQRMLQDNLEAMISRDSRFLVAVSQGLLPNLTPTRKQSLSRLAKDILKEPEILAIAIQDRSQKTIIQESKPIPAYYAPFTMRMPILVQNKPIGWIRAWYSPGLALEEYWRMAGDLVIVLLSGTLVIFVIIFLVVNEWILARPFRRLLSAIDSVQAGDILRPIEVPQQRDEWGMLATRLNKFLGHVIDLQEQSRVLNETSRLLGLPWELKESLEGILTGLLHRYNLSACLVFSRTHGQELRVQFASGISETLVDRLSMRLGEGAGGVAYASATRRLIPELNGEHGNDPVLQELVQRQQIRSALFVPMEGDGRTWGVAAFVSRTPNNFSEAAVHSLENFTSQLALAVRNAQWMSQLSDFNKGLELEVAATTSELTKTNQRLVQKVRELKTIYDLALATAASTNVDDIIHLIIQSVKELVEVSGAAFFFYDKPSGQLEPVRPAFDLPVDQTHSLAFRLEETKILERVIKDGQPQILNFVEPSEQLPISWKDIPIRSILSLPLRQGERVVGVFCVINKTNGLFSDDDVRILSLLTGRVAEVLNRLTLDQQLRQRVQDLSMLQDIALHLPNPPVLVETVNAIAKISRKALRGVDMCLFFLHHAESEALVVMGGDWDPSIPFDAKALTLGVSQQLPLADVFREGQIASYGGTPSASNWEKDDLVQGLNLKEILYLPLRVQEEQTIGVMALGCRQAGVVTTEHRRVAMLIAEQVAVMIERARLYERLSSANHKLEQINHLKNEFISMVSHELRTPLTTIKGYVSIVLSGETGALKDQQKYFLETSDRAIDRLTLLVSDLLDISRLEAGQIQMQLRPISLIELVSRVSVNFAPQMKAQALELKVNIPDNIPMLLADPHRLTQVFDNLMTNALKATAKGGITISAADKGDFVRISIRDTGIGLPPSELDRIFEKFYQVKVGGAWPSKGTGLGLAIVKSIVESHRGKVWVESEAGKGAEFHFLIPRARPGMSEAGPTTTSGRLV